MYQFALLFTVSFFILSTQNITAKPHFNQSKVPQDKISNNIKFFTELEPISGKGLEIFRVDIEWIEKSETFLFAGIQKEYSGTTALEKNSKKVDKLGSFKGVLTYQDGSKAYGSVGIGSLFKKLTHGMTFRFPNKLSRPTHFSLTAENTRSGLMEEVVTKELSSTDILININRQDLDVTLLRKAIDQENKLVIAIYAEDYKDTARDKKRFLTAAKKAIRVLDNSIPMSGSFEYIGVFASSTESLKAVKPRDYNQGDVLKIKKSFLGLQHPYWTQFGRWYHVVYPTNEQYFRNAIGQVRYDYPLVLVKSNRYWGVGNYNEFTAIPDSGSNFSYLLKHEFGHFLGLNEEYEEAATGRTELEFSPSIQEPWSQNMTFARDGFANLKWKHLLKVNTPLPTLRSDIRRGYKLGAFEGGYAGSFHHIKGATNYKPTNTCVMDSGAKFCKVCHEGMKTKFQADL